MKKRIEMRLGEYRLIGKLAENGAVTVLVEHALERRTEAEMILGGDDRSDEVKPSSESIGVSRRTANLVDAEEDAVAPTSHARVEPAPHEPSFPPRPGMTRSRVEPSDD